MSKERLPNINSRLLSVPLIMEQLEETKTRVGEERFLQLVEYLQYNVPLGELEQLLKDGLYPRGWVEYDIEDGSTSQLSEDMALFKRYVSQSQKVMEEGYSFLFFGPNAAGKSFLALYILCGFIERNRSGFYIHFKNYMQLYNDTAYAREGSKVLVRHLYGCDLLVLDEVGKEASVTENVLGEFEHLLKHRTANNLPTILVTNLTVKDMGSKKIETFAARYGNSLASLIQQKYRFIQFAKDNEFRMKTRKEWLI